MVDYNDKKKKFPKMNPAVLSLTSLQKEKKLTVKKRTKTAREQKNVPRFSH